MKILFITIFIFLLDSPLKLLYSQQITWSRTYGDTGTVSEQGVDILQTFDGNYVVLASRSYDGNNQKILLLKLDIYGNVLWEKMVADSILHHSPYRFQQTKDSGFIITGITGSAFLIKTDKNGNLKWRKVYTDTYPQAYSFSVKTTPDNGFIFCGRVPFFNPPSDKGYVVKTDSAGNVQWERVYVDSLFTSYHDIILSTNGKNYYIAGRTYNITQPLTPYSVIRKLELNSKEVWMRTYVAGSSGVCIFQSDDTSLIVNSSSFSTSSFVLIKMNEMGDVSWIRGFMSPSISSFPVAICEDNRNNIQKVGNINSDIAYTEISPSGQQLELRPFKTSGFLATYGNVIKNSKDSGFIIVGGVATGTQSHPKYDILVLKTDSLGYAPILVKVMNTNVNHAPSEFELLQNYPNPFNSTTRIKFRIPKKENIIIKIYDASGKEIYKLIDSIFEIGEYIINFDSRDLASGIYFYKLYAGEYFSTKKMLLTK